MSEDYTVFGYGSLIWKPPPHVIRKQSGFLKRYVRRFAQSSSDHRGTPEVPGRVVTLIHVEEWANFNQSDAFPEDDLVWGIAYTIDPNYAKDVREYLDHREKDGYTEHRVDVYWIVDGREEVVVPQATVSFVYFEKCPSSEHKVYVGKADNPSFVGSEPLDILSRRIFESYGPSGTNKDYLYQLVKAVKELSSASRDSHLEALERLVRRLDADHGVAEEGQLRCGNTISKERRAGNGWTAI